MKKVIHYCWFGDKPLPKLAKKCIKSWKKFLPDYEIIKWSEENIDINECEFVSEAYKNKKWAFVADYVRAKVLKEYGGIYFDTDMEVTKDISKLLEDKTFLGIEDSGYVAVGVWHEKEKEAFLPTALLNKYKSMKEFDVDNMFDISIPKIISELLKDYDLKFGSKEIQVLSNGITIYPRDYFYPYSYHRDDNIFTENTCMIHYYDASWIPLRGKIETALVRRFGKDGTNRILNTYRRLKLIILKILRIPLFPIVIYRRIKRKQAMISKEYLDRLDETIAQIQKNKNKEYITFYNKQWFGVSSATKELFDNLVDCGEIYRKKDIKKIVKAIKDTNAKQIVFSAFVEGWKDLVKEIKKNNKAIKLKTFWHGSHSQILDSYGWERNLEIIELHKNKKIDVMGTCKKSLMNFYKMQNYNAYFITNKVSDINIDIEEDKNDFQNTIGIYAAKCDDWRKNMYSQMASIALIENAKIDMVPLNDQAKEFAKIHNIEIQGIEKSIPRSEIMKRMRKNIVNLYVTFSECAPMLPLESMELGVPCITGNNHHYFEGTELEKYIVVNNETDILEIKNKIIACIENKEKIIELYRNFSNKNVEESLKNVEEFLKL